MSDNSGPKKPGFSKRCAAAFKKAAAQDWKGVLTETAKDLRTPKELALLAASSFIPGGWVGYGGYRLAKFHQKNTGNAPANDDDGVTAPPLPEVPPAKPKRPKAPGT